MIPTTMDAYQLLHRGARALARVEAAGIRIDEGYLDSAIVETGRKIAQLDKELRQSDVVTQWSKKFGPSANLQSRDQLGQILSGVLGLDLPKTDSGRTKTDVLSLSNVSHPFVKAYFDLAKLKKARSTYLVGLKREVVDGYVHPFFNLHTVQTYRSSSDSPNFQNFPSRDKEIRNLIRRAFVPRPGRRLVEVDYGGIEVRVAACYHKDPTMLEYIHDPSKDMHRDMAMQCFCLLDTEITKELRFDAKSFFVFAQFYGDYYGNCAPKLWDSIADKKTAAGVSVRKILLERKKIKFLGDTECPKGSFMAHIKAIQDDFWGTRFPIYGRWRKEWVKAYEKSGELKLLTGFVCRGLKRKNEIINYPIQGSAFHCLLWCLIRIVLVELRKRKLKSLIVGQIHDSLVGDVLENETEDFEALVREIMTEVLPAEWSWIIVPLTIEITRYSNSWAEGD